MESWRTLEHHRKTFRKTIREQEERAVAQYKMAFAEEVFNARKNGLSYARISILSGCKDIRTIKKYEEYYLEHRDPETVEIAQEAILQTQSQNQKEWHIDTDTDPNKLILPDGTTIPIDWSQSTPAMKLNHKHLEIYERFGAKILAEISEELK